MLEQSLEQVRAENDAVKVERQSSLQQIREAELELRKLHSMQAASQEKLQLLTHWQNECEQLNQELRAQREINSAQEAELREVSTRLDETRMAAEDKQRLLINSEQRLSSQFENLANRTSNKMAVADERTTKARETVVPLREKWTVSVVRAGTASGRRRVSETWDGSVIAK